MIADDSGAIGLGGIIGGESTGVDEATTDVLLECAWFDPEVIAAHRPAPRRCSTDARTRFERGVDPMKLSSAIESAAQMILDLCGGEASEPRISGEFPADGYPNRDRVFRYRPSRLAALGGVDLARAGAARRSSAARIPARSTRTTATAGSATSSGRRRWRGPMATSWFVRAPTWRPDVDGEADLVEEIARIHGYDKVPSTPLEREPGVAHPTATRSQLIERRVRRTAAARGLDEAVTWSFISEKEAAAFGGGDWRLANPISEEMKVMRPSLLPGLIAAARRNLDRGAAVVRLFEIGRRYLGDGERPTLSLLLAGDKQPRDWQCGQGAGFRRVRRQGRSAGAARSGGRAGRQSAGVPGRRPDLAPGPLGDACGWARRRSSPRSASCTRGWSRELDAPAGAVAAEIYLDAIPAPRSSGRARPAFAPPALQAVTRDFAFIVPGDLPADDLVRAIRGADKAAITAVRLFDRFEPDGRRCSAWRSK